MRNTRNASHDWIAPALVVATCVGGCSVLSDESIDTSRNPSSSSSSSPPPSTPSASPAADGAATNGTSSIDGGSANDGGIVYPPGPPGCGLAQAAFCETFDAPANASTRAGELDPHKWSAARMCNIGGPSAGDNEAVAIGRATVPPCRAGLPAAVGPNADTLVCDGNATIKSNHLLALVAAQNYGQNSYRVRQPFDFANRTGTIVFDAEGYNVGLHGWISVAITQQPTPAPSFTLQQNYENGSVPENGIEIHFTHNCGGTKVGLGEVLVYDRYTQTSAYTLGDHPGAACVDAAEGKLNHFEVTISNQRVTVYASPASNDGVTFGPKVEIGAADIALPFTRGYVHVTTHNHATLKYSNGAMDAWHARWDNVGFDGPAITGGWREYEALDSLTASGAGMTNVGWRLVNEGQGSPQAITISGVDKTGVTRARLAVQNWSLHFAGTEPNPSFAINYRLNGHAWKTRTLTSDELDMMRHLPNAGTRSLMLDVDVADLAAGNNVLELTTSNAVPNPPPVVLNVDLILETTP